MFCHLPDSGRHVASVFQGFSLSLAPGGGKERTLRTRLHHNFYFFFFLLKWTESKFLVNRSCLLYIQGEYIAPEKIENIYTHCSMVHQVLVYGDSRKVGLVIRLPNLTPGV